ncbi:MULTISPECIES: glycosyltransferase [Actinosynnema]|uniref:glycosyltransferase n=1 Tax=Actinosynnema TaxID=40566 RepID=UPI0020A54982|nr:glycosyltransferase [Actinosynnema pretiosum]MCP2092453.1 glycosyltransferase, MGT family [Actinosynnema pretiosum]
MRVLFTFVGGLGHFLPLVPTASAVRAAGHEVAFACASARRRAVRAAGFEVFDLGGSTAAPPRLPLLAPDREREDHDLREGFARREAGRRAPLLLELLAAWRPDVVVCEEVDFGGVVAAERAGVPHVNAQVIAAGSFVRPEVVGEPLAELRAAHGLPADPDLLMLSRNLLLSPFPPSFRDPAFPLPGTGFPVRPVVGPVGRSSGTAVCFTLGTVFNSESGDLFARVLAGLAGLPVDVVATVGEHVDPAEFRVGERVRVERYLPQSQVLPGCDVVVSHGGSGSVMGALGHGVPLVLLPMGADQPHNAERCERLGVGVGLDPVGVTPEGVREAVVGVLAGAHREAALAVREEMLGLPEPAAAVPLLEELARRSEQVG